MQNAESDPLLFCLGGVSEFVNMLFFYLFPAKSGMIGEQHQVWEVSMKKLMIFHGLKDG